MAKLFNINAMNDTQSITERLQQQDWAVRANELHLQGYTGLKALLSHEECDMLSALYPDDRHFRKTINMARYRFGSGEYKYFQYPLPESLQTLRTALYPYLVPVANLWMQAYKETTVYPATHEMFLAACHAKGQVRPTPLLLTYAAGDYNTLHQDLYGEVFFPLQAVVMLSDPATDFTGGELVLTEQKPRMQSRAVVLTPAKGDVLIFTTHSRPVSGTRGFYRAAMKHGVSAVHSGHRKTLGIIFHDAL
jgi:hypothetical protein